MCEPADANGRDKRCDRASAGPWGAGLFSILTLEVDTKTTQARNYSSNTHVHKPEGEARVCWRTSTRVLAATLT